MCGLQVSLDTSEAEVQAAPETVSLVYPIFQTNRVCLPDHSALNKITSSPTYQLALARKAR